MEYTFRPLTSQDIFPMSKIVSKIGIKEFKDCFNSDDVKKLLKNSGKDAQAANIVGMSVFIDIAGVILSHLGDCETDIYNFLSSITGLKVDELKQAPLADFAEMVLDLFTRDDFKDFFKVVSKLLK